MMEVFSNIYGPIMLYRIVNPYTKGGFGSESIFAASLHHNQNQIIYINI